MSGLYIPDESGNVLCPELYGRLRTHFPGGVIIANQGEGMQQSSYRLPDGRVHTTIHSSGEYYRVNCPYCRDTRHRLWVNHMYGQLDAEGRPMLFLATCYNEDTCMGRYENRRNFHNLVCGFINANRRNSSPFALNYSDWSDPGELANVEPPGQIIPMIDLLRAQPDHPAVQYLCQQRRYTSQMLMQHELGYCIQSPRYPIAQNRIIIPIRMNGNLVGWQARYVGDNGDWRHIPKYYGLPGMHKRLMLYNYDRAKDKPYVAIMEGATDCHVAGDYSVGLLGKTMSSQQKSMILGTWGDKPILMVLDPDARDQMAGAVADLRANNAIVVDIHLPDGYDPGDYDPRTFWNIVRSRSRDRGVLLPS